MQVQTDYISTTGKLSNVSMQTFEKLFRQYYQVLCIYAVKFVHDADTAEEIVQDLFYVLWEKRAELQINTSVKSYLYSAVHNRCLKYINHKKVETRYQHFYLNNKAEISEEPENGQEVMEVHRIVNNTLEALPERCSEIFRLNRFEGLKYYEIAEKLAISIKTVEANMGKALKALRKSLRDYTEMA